MFRGAVESAIALQCHCCTAGVVHLVPFAEDACTCLTKHLPDVMMVPQPRAQLVQLEVCCRLHVADRHQMLLTVTLLACQGHQSPAAAWATYNCRPGLACTKLQNPVLHIGNVMAWT